MADSVPQPKRRTRFFEELTKRNVRKTLAIYLSAALTATGMANVFSVRYQLPAGLFDTILIFLIFGFFSVGVYAWFRGAENRSGERTTEFFLHGGIVLAACGTAFLFSTIPRSSILPRNAKTIAVLPFSIQSEKKEDEYFGDGIMEDILTNLSKIEDLRVISRTSAMQYKEGYRGKTMSLRDIGRELNVGTILEGSVRRFADQVRISSRLVNAETDENIWGEVYHREMKNVFEIQADVARKIAESLQATLSPDEEKLIDQKPTENPEAYAYYLRGRDLYYRYLKDENEQAIGMFRKAIEIDPGYALAYAGLADAFGQRVQRFQYPAEWADSAMALSRKAIRLNPDIAEPYKSLGLALAQKYMYRQAIEQYEQAVRINPNYSTAVSNLGLTLLWLGQPEQALPLIRKAVILTPERATSYAHLGTVFEALGADSLAELYLRKSIELNPQLIFPQIILAEKMVHEGKSESGKRMIDSLLAVYPEDLSLMVTAGEMDVASGNLESAERYFRRTFDYVPPEDGPTTQLAHVLTEKGKRDEANTLLAKSLEVGMARIAEGGDNYDTPMDIARVYSIRGDTAMALQWLRRTVSMGWILYSDIEFEPFFGTIMRTEQFHWIVDSLRASAETTRRRLEAEGMLY